MTSFEKDDLSSSNLGQEMAADETADAQMSYIVEAVTMSTTTESVISESANVVVQRMSAGSPTWTLTGAVGDSEREVTGEVSKDEDTELFNIQGSGLLTQAQLRQIGEALRAEVNPSSIDEDLQIGMMEHQPVTMEVGMDSGMMETDSRHDMEGVVSGDNPMFSGSDQQVDEDAEQYDELSLHAADDAVEELEGERQLILGLTDASETRPLTVGLDDSGEGLGSRQFFDDVMNTDILSGAVKEVCLDAAVDIAATATVTTSEEGELHTSGEASKKSKASTTPKRQGTRRSARLAKSASTDDASSDTGDKKPTEDTKPEPSIKPAKKEVKETTETTETTEGRTLRHSSQQQRAAEPYSSKISKSTEKAEQDKENRKTDRTDEKPAITRDDDSGKTKAEKVEKKHEPKEITEDKKRIVRRDSLGTKVSKTEGSKISKTVRVEIIDIKPTIEKLEPKRRVDKKECLEEGELDDGDDLEEGEVRDSPKKKQAKEKSECDRSRGERSSSRSERESQRRRHRRDSKERRQRRSSSERRERREARMRRREKRRKGNSDSDSDDKPLAETQKELQDKKASEDTSKTPTNTTEDGLPRRYSLDDAKKLNSPPMARRSKPFSAADRQRKKVVPIEQPKPSPVKKPADSNEESDISFSSSDGANRDANDSDWTTDDDPDKLWCICRRPADNRFMIRCDDCAEWYHGSCVNISKQEGQRLDKENIQWICPHCVKKEKRDARGVMPKGDRDRHHSSKREDKSHDGSREKSHDGSREKSHDGSREKSHDSSRRRSKDKKKRLKFSKPEPPKQHCLGIKCENWAKPGAIYCSTRCIVSHCRDSLKLIEQEKEKAVGPATSGGKQRRDSFGDALSPSQGSSKPADREPERISVIERHTGRLRTGLSAPTRLQLPIWLERHPTYEVLKPNMKHGYTTSQFYSGSKSKHSSSSKDRHDRDSKQSGEIREGSKSSSHSPGRVRRESESKSAEVSSRRDSATKKERRDSHHEAAHTSTHHDAGSSKKEKSDNGKKSKTPIKTPPNKAAEEVQESVRMSVKRTLWDVLWTRVKACEDFRMPEHKVKKIAYHIENHLFKFYNETNIKYKAKYRSLIFNIKDPKNQGLFRRILKGRIPAEELVLMSSDKLASKDLAEWREREAKHVLDMIVTEEENRKVVPLTKKTHKGEVEIAEDLSMLESNMGSPTLKVSTSGLELLSPPPLTSPTNPLAMLQDTTEQHSSHLFDMNCKICTGKVAPPREENIAIVPQAAKRSRTMSGSDRQSSTEEEGFKKRHAYMEEEEEEEVEEGVEDKEEGELDEDDDEEEMVTMEKPSYSYSEEAETRNSPEYEPPDVSSPDGHHTSSSYLPASTSSSRPVDTPIGAPREQPHEADEDPPEDIPVSPAMSSPEQEKPPKRITPPVMWKGVINMPEVARFTANGYHVSGPPHTIATDIPHHMEICGRIPHKVVWDYFNKLRSSRTTELIIVRFHIAQDQDKPPYASLFQYFHSRKRIGVVGNNRPNVKDMYLMPLSAHESVPVQIQPFNGPGLERHRPHTFLGLIVRHKEQRLRSASMGQMPVSERSALPGGNTHPTQLKRHLSEPEASAGGTPPPDWTEQNDFDAAVAAAKRAKQEQNIPQTQINDPIVAQYANADPTEMAEEPYSPTREEREAPYDPSDVMDDIGEVKRRDESQIAAKKDIEGGTPPIADNPEFSDPTKLNNLLENMNELNANDIAHAASDVTENLLTAFSSKPNLTEQQQLLIKLTKQVEDAKKALLDRQIASLQSEIDKAATEITIASAPEGPIGDDMNAPAVTATLMHQLPGTKLPSPRILRAPADSSTNATGQVAMNMPGSPGTPTEEDAQGRSGLGMIQSAYLDPSLESKKATYTYGNVFTEGGASYPAQMQGLPPLAEKRPPINNNNQSQVIPPNAPNWNIPPYGAPEVPQEAFQGQPWDNQPFQPAAASPGMKPNSKQEPNPQQFNPHREERKRDSHRQGGERFPPDGRPDHAPPRHNNNKSRGWEGEQPQWGSQLEEGEWPPQDNRGGHHRSGPPDHEPWRSGHRGHRGQGPPRGGHRGPPDSGHRGRGGGGHGHRRDDSRGNRGQGEGHRGWGGNGPDRGWGKRSGQGGRGREHGGNGRDHGGNSRYDYHRY